MAGKSGKEGSGGKNRGGGKSGGKDRARGGTPGGGERYAEGDEVAWNSHGSSTEGTVEREITRRTEAAGRTVDAAPDAPQYEVRSDKSGKRAVHKPSALRKK
ncbi:HVA1 family protein [Streptomyces sp. PRKS01-65]|nr:HVA1 family protein [Streptomyces harenosi]